LPVGETVNGADRREDSSQRSLKAAEVVAADLRRLIIRGEIAEGDSLPSEQAMMASYSVSRPSLREALRILESEGLIVIRRGVHGGARASRPSIARAAGYVGALMESRGITLVDVYDARTWIEPAAAKLLAEQRSRARQVRQLTAMLEYEAAVHGSDDEEYIRSTFEFSKELIELSGNKTLSLLWQALHHVISIEFSDFLRAASPRAFRLRQEHCAELLRLITKGDGEAVEEYWRQQLMHVRPWVANRHSEKTIVDML
jgi:DNA-binding FadR family transcriptional regulator